MALSRELFRVPRPRTFLYLMTLQTGTSLIALSLLLNKLSGLYGLLALLTGFSLSPLQLSMYLYSLAGLVLTAILAPHIRSQSPFHTLALAWFYIIDSLINVLYTVAFAMTWFLVVSQTRAEESINLGPGGKTMSDTAGFTSPEFENVTQVDVIATPGKGLTGQEAVAIGTNPTGAGSANTVSTPSLSHGFLQPESVPSITVITLLWLVRLYFILVVMAYARSVLRLHMHNSSRTHLDAKTNSHNPFAETSPEGKGWKGKLGRIMVSVGKEYWLGSEEEEGWARGLGGRFQQGRNAGVEGGVVERERRRRSGTGPSKTAPPAVV